MNKAQKTILTIYIILGFIFWMYSILIWVPTCSTTANYESLSLTIRCGIERFITIPVLIYLIFGIPTFFVYKVWGDKK